MGAAFAALDVIEIKIKESKPLMQAKTHDEGLTLIVLHDQFQADVDETKNEKIDEGVKEVDPSKKS